MYQAYTKAIDVIITVLCICIRELVDEIALHSVQCEWGMNQTF